MPPRWCRKQGPLRGANELGINWEELCLTGVEQETMESAKVGEGIWQILVLFLFPFCLSSTSDFAPLSPLHIYCVWWGACVKGFFLLLRSVHFYFVVIYFWPAISLMHQLVKAKCELACQHSLCISVNFCLLKTLLSAAASNRENRSQESVIRSFFLNCIMLHI